MYHRHIQASPSLHGELEPEPDAPMPPPIPLCSLRHLLGGVPWIYEREVHGVCIRLQEGLCSPRVVGRTTSHRSRERSRISPSDDRSIEETDRQRGILCRAYLRNIPDALPDPGQRSRGVKHVITWIHPLAQLVEFPPRVRGMVLDQELPGSCQASHELTRVSVRAGIWSRSGLLGRVGRMMPRVVLAIMSVLASADGALARGSQGSILHRKSPFFNAQVPPCIYCGHFTSREQGRPARTSSRHSC